ncbi:MAG: lytic transglycosylase domain-containing protein [Armatimonadota bacterium]|nr:lytic transglycosylase domain-containing protein [bacterium]MDW8322450.1 lytic transglycosylase domain-containing protein [Armatimonadota bacterium]
MRTWWVWTILLVCWGAPLWADVAGFVKARQSLKATPVGGVSDLQQNVHLYRGKVVELTATVKGVSRVGDAQVVVLQSLDGASVCPRTSQLLQEQLGAQLRVLLRVGEGNFVGLSDAELIHAVHEADIALWEAQQRRKQEAPKPPQRAARALTSRFNTPVRTSQGAVITFEQWHSAVYDAYARAISRFNPRLKPQQIEVITNSILAFSWYYRVDPRLVVAMVLAESGFRPDAVSRAGAMGLGQLMPRTARGLGVSNPFDPVQNLAGSIRLLHGHLNTYSGGRAYREGTVSWNDIILAMAAYNAGSGAVRKYGGVPPYRETQTYVRRVIQLYKQLCGMK